MRRPPIFAEEERATVNNGTFRFRSGRYSQTVITFSTGVRLIHEDCINTVAGITKQDVYEGIHDRGGNHYTLHLGEEVTHVCSIATSTREIGRTVIHHLLTESWQKLPLCKSSGFTLARLSSGNRLS